MYANYLNIIILYKINIVIILFIHAFVLVTCYNIWNNILAFDFVKLKIFILWFEYFDKWTGIQGTYKL